MAGLHSGDWQQKKTVLQCNKYMFDNRICCDVTFTFKNKEKDTISKGRSQAHSNFLLAHKYVLMSRSAFFYNKFSGQEKNCSMNIIDVEMDIFNKMLRFLYYEESDLTTQNAVAMLQCAKKYMVVELADRCRHVIERSLDKQNVCLFLDQLHGMGETNLDEKCLELLDSVADEVIQSPHFKHVKMATLQRIVSRDTLDVGSELEVFNACVSWAEAKCSRNKQQPTDENIRTTLGDVISQVRFPTMTLKDYSTQVATRNILNADDAMKVMLYLNKTKATCDAAFPMTKRQGPFRDYLFGISTIKMIQAPRENRDTYVTVRENMRIAAIFFINPSDLNLPEITFGSYRTSKISAVKDHKVAGYDLHQAVFDRPIVGTPGEYPVSFPTAVERNKAYPAIDYDEKIYDDGKPIFPSYNEGFFLIGFKYKLCRK